jgi:UDP-galactopyranose mutase
LVEGKHVPIPVNIDTVNALFDMNIQNEQEMDEWLKKEQVTFKDDAGNEREPINSEEVALTRVGHRLYNLIFKPYTWKQWAKDPSELGPEVLSRIPVRNNRDERYFSDKYQALPTNGYTSLFDKMLDSPLITVLTNVDYFEVKDKLQCKRLYYTGPIDAYFNYLGWPKLEYRSLSFERGVKRNTKYFQPAGVVNHPQAKDFESGKDVDFTRIVEYKWFLNQKSDHTVYFIERSTDEGEPYYPVPNDKNKELYKKYQDMAMKEDGVRFVGRLANYKYFNMDEAILNALKVVDEDTGRVVAEE